MTPGAPARDTQPLFVAGAFVQKISAVHYSVEGWPQADAVVLPKVAVHYSVEGWPQAGAFVVGACEEEARAAAADGVVVC